MNYTYYKLPDGWTADNASDCRSCGAPIMWAKNDKSGKKAPFDPLHEGDVSVSHFATCPQAAAWRRDNPRH
jgi:hypothetical protein